MRKIIYILILLTPFLNACESFLSQVPDDRTEIKDLDAVKSLLVSAYPEGHYMLQTEWMSDNADDKGIWTYTVYPQMQEEAYYWEDATAENQDSPMYYWTCCYAAIAAANHALEAIEEMGNKAEFAPYRGEALVARAYAHFMLVNLWGKHYNPATAATDLGVAYVEVPEKNALAHYQRHTVQEVYDFIERDLKEGLPLIRDNAYDVAKYHFTKSATHAFAARYYLYKGNAWNEVLEHATQVLGEGTSYKTQLRNYVERYIPISSNAVNYRQLYTNYGESAILLLTNGPSIWWRAVTLSRYGLSDRKLTEFNNLGSATVTGSSYVYVQYGSSPNNTLNKFEEYFKYSYPGATVGLPFVFCPVLTMEEVAFNRAEAYVMLGEYDKALADINTFMSMRIKNYNPGSHEVTLNKIKSYYAQKKDDVELAPWYRDQINEDQMFLLRYITELRRKEFFSEGMRWFDIKRFHIQVVHREFGTDKQFVLTKDDLRRELQIPATAISYGMEPNPR